MRDKKPEQETFIIRLWKKSSRHPAWYGQAQNIRTGQQVIIHSLLDLEACFKDYLPATNEPPDKPSGLH